MCQGDKRDRREFYSWRDERRSYFRTWFQENSNLVYYGQTLQKRIEVYSETEAYKKGYRKEGGLHKRLLAPGMAPCWQDIDDFLKQLEEARNDDMRLAVSERPVFTLVPSQTRVGDVVCLLRGAACPIVLRPQGDAYVFIGLVDHYPVYHYHQHHEISFRFLDTDWQRLHII